MKNPKSKSAKKETKKKIVSNIEIDLSKKIKDFIYSLGHDAEDIGSEIKKATKIISKKLSKKTDGVKNSIKDKFKKAGKEKEDVKKVVKKEVAKAKKEVSKSVNKALKKAEKVKKEISEKVEPIVKKASSVNKLNPIDEAKIAFTGVKSDAKKLADNAIKSPIKKRNAAATTAKRNVKPAIKIDTSSSSQKEVEPEEIKLDNIHPETPQVTSGTKRAIPAPKSDSKPHNTDLPTHAGPQNKYKRG